MFPIPIISNTNKVQRDNTIKQIVSNYMSTLIVYNDGRMYGYGWNYGCSFGIPQRDLAEWTLISTGIDEIISFGVNSAVYRKNGEICVCGGTVPFGGANLGEPPYSFYPLKTILQNQKSTIDVNQIKDIQVTMYVSYILLNNKELYVCGFNDFWQLGMYDTPRCSVYTKCTSAQPFDRIMLGYKNAYGLSGSTLYHLGYAEHMQGPGSSIQIWTYSASGVTDFSMTQDTSYIYKDSNVYGCGLNTYGQLGIGNKVQQSSYALTNLSSLKSCKFFMGQANSGSTSPVVVTDTGIYRCGWNYYGQRGDGTQRDSEWFKAAVLPIPLQNIKLITAANENIYIVGTDNTLYGCGAQLLGDTNANTYNQSFIKIPIPV